MAEEIFSEQGRMADDGSLAKVLFYDIVRQYCINGAILHRSTLQPAMIVSPMP